MECFLDRARAARIMRERGLDALLALTPANVHYTTGHLPAFGGITGGMSLTPADETTPGALIVNGFELGRAQRESQVEDVRPGPIWIEIDEVDELRAGRTVSRPKPVQFDFDYLLNELGDVLRSRGLDRARIGCEFTMLSLNLARLFERLLPDIELVDAADTFYEIRLIKAPGEIDIMRRACRLADVGVRAMVESNVRGKSVSQLRFIYEEAIIDACKGRTDVDGLVSARAFITVGGDISPTANVNLDVAEEGATLFIDYGATVLGYASDAGRSFAVGQPDPLTDRIMRALLAAQEKTLPMFKPGTRMSEVFEMAQETVRENGFPTYTRGHVGHATGIGFGEQPPFLAPGEDRPIEPGMLICFETPYYVRGLGGHQIEEVLAITENGAERLTTLPLGLQVI
jgi:Xaa-Pro aminopeptidase